MHDGVAVVGCAVGQVVGVDVVLGVGAAINVAIVDGDVGVPLEIIFSFKH